MVAVKEQHGFFAQPVSCITLELAFQHDRDLMGKWAKIEITPELLCRGRVDRLTKMLALVQAERWAIKRGGPSPSLARGGDFRSLADDWYGFCRGVPFVKQTGTVRWLNRGDLLELKLRKAIRTFDFLSKAAWELHEERRPDRWLVKDHAIPLICIKRHMIEENLQTILEVEEILFERYRLGLITKAEDAKLNEHHLRQAMPCGREAEPFARYLEVGIECAHDLPNPNGVALRSILTPLPADGLFISEDCREAHLRQFQGYRT